MPPSPQQRTLPPRLNVTGSISHWPRPVIPAIITRDLDGRGFCGTVVGIRSLSLQRSDEAFATI
jgi:hypothetical protein